MDYRDINLPTDGKWDLIFQGALRFNFCFFSLFFPVWRL